MRTFLLGQMGWVLLGVALLLAGCSDGGGPSSNGDGPTYVSDIQALMAAKCVDCHTEGGIGPFPLRTYEQVTAVKGAVATSVKDRIMPPWLAAPGCADYAGDFSLSDEQIAMIGAWVDNGAPMGDPSAAPNPVEKTRLTLSRVDRELSLPVPYTPKAFPDDYRCFFLDWPATETEYISGYGVEPGNSAIVHHVIGYMIPPGSISIFQTLDDADPEPGWPCFGTPGGEGPGSATWIAGWAPGGLGEDFPEGTGIEIPVGAKLVVQMHYNSEDMNPAPDQTKIVVKIDKTVTKRGAIMPFADFSWVMQKTMDIPAHSTDVVHSLTQDPTTLVSLLTGGALSGNKPLTLYDAGMHMHTLGTRGSTRIERADGSRECMVDIPRWDFNWQSPFRFAAPKVVNPGDKVFLECHWDNPGNKDVNWGESTSDEMCLGVYYVTE